MICEKCGTVLEDDQVFCPKCGAEMTFVSEYKPEDDLFHIDMKVVNPNAPKEEEEEEEKDKPRKTMSRRTKFILSGASVFLCIIFIIGGIIIHNNNDYGYQINKAKAELEGNNFKKASEYALRACEIDKSNTESKWVLVNAYKGMHDFQSAYNTMHEILTLTKFDGESFDKAMGIFLDEGQYGEAATLLESTSDINIRDKYRKYISSAPEFSDDSGDYNHEVKLTLKNDSGAEIYYRLDGGDGDKEVLYNGPIKIPAGTHTVRAVSVNEFGIRSSEKTATYNINPSAPADPDIKNESGNVSADTRITITCEEECTMYYTWDGSTPTKDSEKYTEPLSVPKGNNILSVIAIDKYGQASGVARKNFINEENVEE